MFNENEIRVGVFTGAEAGLRPGALAPRQPYCPVALES
jgi:hypothetical protein